MYIVAPNSHLFYMTTNHSANNATMFLEMLAQFSDFLGIQEEVSINFIRYDEIYYSVHSRTLLCTLCDPSH